ncbi:MAG: hypothetical protein KC422_19815 [Trueperaceae bacterium]|nr:hypothetical protein [Trueperaceae bacterium]
MKLPWTFTLCLLMMLLGSSPTLAQGEPVDFGDSGIVVVVEAEGDDTDSGWTYWFPDEFYDYFPPFFRAPILGIEPPWDGGGGNPAPEEPDCEDIIEELGELLNQADLLSNIIDGLSNPNAEIGIVDYEAGVVIERHYPGSPFFTKNLAQKLEALRDMKQRIDELLSKAVTACNES